MAATAATRQRKKAGIRYTRTRSITWIGGGTPPIDCHVSGRAGYVGDPFTITGLPPGSLRSRKAVEHHVRSAIEASGFHASREVLVDVFADTRIKGMTGPLELAMVLMTLSATGQIQPVDWPTLIVGYVDRDGGFNSCGEDLAQGVYLKAREIPDHQLICPKRLLDRMPINRQFKHMPIGLRHLRDLHTLRVFQEPLG